MQHHTQVTILQELMRQLDAGQNIDAGVQYRMPTKDYVCTDRAQQEQQHFFRDHPHVVGLSNDLPENGCFYTVDELGIPILTTRDQTGRFRAFLNACRHRSARVVSETRGKKSVLMCPFHHWSYSVSGELINVPNQDHFGDIDKAEELKNEKEQILTPLSTDFGLGGKPRKIDSPVEKVRKRVEKRISTDIKKLGKSFPQLSKHLACINTGTQCKYDPYPDISWKLD